MRLYRNKDARGKPTGSWIAVFYDHAGTWQRKSTRCQDYEAACERAREFERAGVRPPEPTSPGDARTVGDALKLLISQRSEVALAGKRSPATVKFYAQRANALAKALDPSIPLAALKPAHIDDAITAMRGAGTSEHTIHKNLTTLRAALKLATRREWFSGNILALIPSGFSSGYTPRERALSVAELDALLAALPARRAAHLAFIVATGARWGESLRARREDVGADAMVRLRGTKTALSARVVPVVGEGVRFLRFALERAPAGRQGGAARWFDPWPRNVHRDIAAACARAGIPVCTPNDLRRTFGTWLRAAGAAPELIAPAMGHVDGKMVERVYGRLDPATLRARLLAATGGAPALEKGGRRTRRKSDKPGKPGTDLTTDTSNDNA